MIRGTAADGNDSSRDFGDAGFDKYSQDSESEWQSGEEEKGNDKQPDMDHRDGPYRGRDDHERIAFAASPHWRKDTMKPSALSVRRMNAKKRPNMTDTMIQRFVNQLTLSPRWFHPWKIVNMNKTS
jgi:hypothetical protein